MTSASAYPRTPPPFTITRSGPHPRVIKQATPKYMTLIAGFRCKDGFVVAGDTKITLGNTATQGHKVISYEGSEAQPYFIRIGIAGDEGYALEACQDIRDAVAKLPTATFGEIKLAVRRAIETIYDDQIFPLWHSTGQQLDPWMCLILGVEDVNGQFGVLKTDRNNVHEVDHHACAGAGNEVAEVLVRRLLKDLQLSTAATEQLVCQLFREVKINGVYVGGNTEIVSRRSPTGAPFFNLSFTQEDARFLWGLEEILAGSVRTALTYKHPAGGGGLMQVLETDIADIRARLVRLQNDSRAKQYTKIIRERHLNEYGTDYGNPFVDSYRHLIPRE